MLPPKSGYMLFLLAIALIFMSLFQNGFFQGIETVVAVYSYLRLVWRCLRSHCGRYERPIGETNGPNQPMKPTAPLRCKFSMLATTRSTSSRLPATLVRFVSPRSHTLFTKIASPGSLGALAVRGTSRRIVRVLRTVPAVLLFNDSRGLFLSR